jgi:hypothetical protein
MLNARYFPGGNPTYNLQQGHVVLLREDNTTPLHWPTANITSIHPRLDGIVRLVTLRTPSDLPNVRQQKFAYYRM